MDKKKNNMDCDENLSVKVLKTAVTSNPKTHEYGEDSSKFQYVCNINDIFNLFL